MYVVLAQDAHGATTLYGPFDSGAEALEYATYWGGLPNSCVQLTAMPVQVPLGRVPHPSIVTEAKRQAKADACEDPFFLKGICTSCGTSPARHFVHRSPKVGLD